MIFTRQLLHPAEIDQPAASGKCQIINLAESYVIPSCRRRHEQGMSKGTPVARCTRPEAMPVADTAAKMIGDYFLARLKASSPMLQPMITTLPAA